MKKHRNTQTPNKIYIYNEYAEIYLRNNKQKIIGKCKLDIEDVEKIKYYKWGCSGKYARTSIDGKTVRMHRFILELPEKFVHVHHINGDTFDNRKLNLRIVTPSEHASIKRERRVADIIDCREL